MTILDTILGYVVLASWIGFILLELSRWWKKKRAQRRYKATVAAAGVRPPASTLAVAYHGDLVDECLRRGYHLPASQWIATRTGELAGDLQLAEQEWAQLRQ